MKLIDLHCDTLWKLWRERKLRTSENRQDLMRNTCAVNIPEMRSGNVLAQFFACFTYIGELREGYEECYRDALEMINILEEECDKYPDSIIKTTSYRQMQQNEQEGRISAFLTIEEGGILNGKMERLDMLFRRGVRLLTPIWNYENCIGYPNSRDSKIMEKGLKPFGIEMVEQAGRLGMILDVSHASDETFRDILRYSRGPVIASHSNCRALADHPRNLSDSMIRSLADAGGIGGLNFYGPFLGNPKESRIQEMICHIHHMIRIGGIEFPAIGTDFDGFDGMEYEEIPKTGDMEKLWYGLKDSGISEAVVDKIWRENAENVIKSLSE